jgi:hypothetical protein
MSSVSVKSGRCLMVALLLAPVSMCWCGGVVFARGAPVTSKSLKIDDSQWSSAEAKQENGRFDNLVDKGKKQPAAKLADSSSYATASPEADAANDTAGGSTSDGGSTWVWAILGSLFVVGGGLTCFGYYWSNMRRAASW